MSIDRPRLAIVPFEPTRRPGDEALAPGLGCSEHVDYVDSTSADAPGQELWLLFTLDRLPAGRDVAVELSAWLDGSEAPALARRPVPARAIVRDAEGRPALASADYRAGGRHVAALPGRALLAAATAADPEPFGFRHRFHRRVRVELALRVDGAIVARDACEVEIYDAGRMGSLYRRLCERLLPADLADQAPGRAGLTIAHHPWYPVLAIGMTKADLYMRAIFQDLDDHTTHLPDPRWLLRVGLYLEWLTFLGIVEALGERGRDLLDDAEREHLAGPEFAAVRARLRPEAWREVCAQREVAPPRPGPLGAGPVGLDNLLRKRRATLGFLHAHHEDLKAAIELAGPNRGDAQEAWHRVFRDAERAVLRRARDAFPELERLPAWQREFALWHRRGDFRALGGAALPGWLTGLFGDQDGVFAAACNSYRESLNDVAAWSRARGLMDYTGGRCVPREVSLIEARLAGDAGRAAALQRGDGYGPDQAPDRSGGLRRAALPAAERRGGMLAGAALFAALPADVRARLAARARPRDLAAYERVVVQGGGGDSLFLIVEGDVEVLRRAAGGDRRVARLGAGEVFGERALLTAAPRAATVRAGTGGALVLEIAGDDLRPLFGAHPGLMAALAFLGAERRPPAAPAPEGGLAARLAHYLGRALAPAEAVGLAPGRVRLVGHAIRPGPR
ncbi:MAG TPA: cyclic nucleotide-binding domain-containing protein [Polyangiaceae bacterium]|nr:cyclic nucleotide-binding domain-containing protein [Polyangiaceae bacterium]